MLLFFNSLQLFTLGRIFPFSENQHSDTTYLLTNSLLLLYGISCSTYTAHSSIFLLKVSGRCLALVVMEAVRWRIMGSSRNIFLGSWELVVVWSGADVGKGCDGIKMLWILKLISFTSDKRKRLDCIMGGNEMGACASLMCQMVESSSPRKHERLLIWNNTETDDPAVNFWPP